jgi:SMODS and SLOG-associating 2TM effector domain family 5
MTNVILERREMAQSQFSVRSEIVAAFIRSLDETAGARFIAANRLARRDKRIAELTMFCSIYLVVLTLLPYLLNISPDVVSHLDFFRIVLSIVILIEAVFHYSGNNYAKSEQLHRSGLELNELRREIEMRNDKLDVDEIDIYRVRFEQILQKYTVNHDRSDYLQYQLENRDKYPSINSFSAFVTSTEISLRQSAPRITLIIISAIMLFLVVALFGSYPARLPG